jgi:hypothetical protein
LPPIHQFGVVPFCRRIRRRPTDLVLLFGRRISSPRRNLFVCRRIRRRSTDLVLFHLAGAFPAEPPPFGVVPFWPAHPLAAPPLPI